MTAAAQSAYAGSHELARSPPLSQDLCRCRRSCRSPLRSPGQAKPNAAPLRCTLSATARRSRANFIGLSYEIEQLADPNFFSAANTGLIARFRELTPNGVLRLGGNTSDVGWWKPTPTSTQPPLPAQRRRLRRARHQALPAARLRRHARRP